MKQKLLFFMTALLTTMTAWADVEINEENFPDEKFRNIVLSNCGQDVLTDDEIARVQWFMIPDEGIQSLKGIEYFTALTWLCCDGNQLTELDVSKNTALTDLWCCNNQLTSLDVSQNTALKVLRCLDNQLTELDVSKNTLLVELDCWDNQLTSLDLSNNTALVILDCIQNQLTSLDVSKNTALEYLKCWGNQLTSLDVSKNTALELLECGNDQLTSIDVSKNTALTWLGLSYTPLTSLDVSKNTALEYLDCSGIYQLTSLDLSKNTALEELRCGQNQLTSLDLSNNTALVILDCVQNQLTSLDLSKNTALEELWCYQNQLTSLDLSKNTALEELECWGNQLTSLDVSNTKLTRLKCYQNQIKDAGMDALVESLPTVDKGEMYAIDDQNEGNVVTNAQLEAAKAKGWMVFYCARVGNGWEEYVGDDIVVAINDENFPDENFRNYLLSQEYGTDGVLTLLEIAGMWRINVSGCGIQSLKGIEYITPLWYLDCTENQLTSLDLSKNTALGRLDCWDNQLTSLDVSGCTALEALFCNENQLTSLDLSKNTALEWLYCYENKIKDAAMDALVEGLPTVKEGHMYAIDDVDEENVMTTTQVAAANAKGWKVYYRVTKDERSWEEYAGSEPTGIDALTTDMQDGKYYDLQGHGIDGKPTEPGIYIVDGKKVVVK